MNTTANEKEDMPTKDQVISALRAWIKQRPGLDYGNYGDPVAYRAELRSIGIDKKHAEELLRAVEFSDITVEELLAAFSAFSGRMTYTCKRPEYNGKPLLGTAPIFTLDYCTGQYWPTEYRRVVCAIAAQALWHHYREEYAKNYKHAGDSDGDAIRRRFRYVFGPAIQKRWFD